MAAVWGLDEVCPRTEPDGNCRSGAGVSALEAFRLTLNTGGWIFKTPFVLAVIVFGMMLDGILRMVITLASQYYRMVALPESVFGVLGALTAVAGIFIPRLALRVAETRSPAFCLGSTAATALAGLSGMAFFWPYLGLIPALVAFSALYMVGFYVSYFVNRQTASERRATVLSFKGVAYNLAYGLIGIGYAAVLEARKAGIGALAASPQAVENTVFRQTFIWFPAGLAIGLSLVAVAAVVFKLMSRNR